MARLTSKRLQKDDFSVVDGRRSSLAGKSCTSYNNPTQSRLLSLQYKWAFHLNQLSTGGCFILSNNRMSSSCSSNNILLTTWKDTQVWLTLKVAPIPLFCRHLHKEIRHFWVSLTLLRMADMFHMDSNLSNATWLRWKTSVKRPGVRVHIFDVCMCHNTRACTHGIYACNS